MKAGETSVGWADVHANEGGPRERDVVVFSVAVADYGTAVGYSDVWITEPNKCLLRADDTATVCLEATDHTCRLIGGVIRLKWC